MNDFMESTNEINQTTAEVYCICRSTVGNVFMIMCDYCQEWYHGDCIGITPEMSDEIDMYCCAKCKKLNPRLATTYKNDGGLKIKKNSKSKRKNLKTAKKGSGKTNASFAEYSVKHKDTESKKEVSMEGMPSFNFVNTSTSMPKSEANDELKSSKVAKKGSSTKKTHKNEKNEKVKSIVQVEEPRQCYGPECVRSSRPGSKYCSEKCGISLALNRILEILPQRVRQYNEMQSIAEKINQKQLQELRKQIRDIEMKIAEIDKNIVKLTDDIIQAKSPGNKFAEIKRTSQEDVALFDCILCGAEVQSKYAEKHMEFCYRRIERKFPNYDCSRNLNDEHWNVYCNYRMGKNVYCKKMKVLCPLHYRGYRKNNEVCGYPIRDDGENSIYCGNVGRTCCHLNWEDMQRAQLDLEKLRLYVKHAELSKEVTKIRQQMALRGDVLSLMLHTTIAH